MTIFVGAFQHDELFYRIATIVSISAIVVTAVYILRVVGLMLMGPLKNEQYKDLPRALWFEKVGAVLLIIPIMGIGMAPLWLSDMINASLIPMMEKFFQ